MTTLNLMILVVGEQYKLQSSSLHEAKKTSLNIDMAINADAIPSKIYKL
jgi:hypothetical protein